MNKMAEKYNAVKMNEYNRIRSELMTGRFSGLSNALYKKDCDTFAHCQRVSLYCFLIGKELQLSKSKIEALVAGALFHDIGKIAVPHRILNKPGMLSGREWKTMRLHSKAGAGLLRAAGYPEDALTSVACHHEYYNGTGYPFGFKGEEIPFLSRIIAVADAYDAMTTRRRYAEALESGEAMNRLFSNRGSQFDPVIADVFLNIMQSPQMQLQAI